MIKYTVNNMYSCLTQPLILFIGIETDKKLICELCNKNVTDINEKFICNK